MSFRSLSVVLGLVLLGGAWSINSATAQHHRLPSERHSTLQAPSSVSQQRLSFTAGDSLRALDRQRNRLGPYRYGRTLDTHYTPTQHGDWEQLPSGDWVWRLRIRSRDAVSLSVGFSRFQLPKNARLYLHGPDNQLVRGPYTAADATNGELWTPLVEGEELILELEVSKERRGAVELVVGTVVYGYRSITPAVRNDGMRTKSGTCNLDVACEEADVWRDEVRSVGGFTLQNGQDALYCTGTLLNNTSRDNRPFFLTAEHCVSTADDATSMVFYWNFELSTCRTQGTDENGTFPDSMSVSEWEQTSSGAVLRARYGNVHSDGQIAGKSDLSLVEVDDAIPDDYQLYLSGWSRSGLTTQESVTIHHPAGHGKRISEDRDPSSFVDYPSSATCSAPQGDTHLLIQDWELGTTEPGSSGAPLFDTNGHVVGVLSGGCAGCGGDGDIDDNNAPDWYGRIAPGFQNGDYTPPGHQQPTTLADVLDPVNTGQQELDGQYLHPDSIPPAPVSDFRVDRDSVTPDSVTLRWTASGDDGTKGTAQSYDLRYRTTEPITSPAGFAAAKKVSIVPQPKSAGTEQSVTISVNQDTSYYFAIRAVDEANQVSPIATTDRDVTPVSALRIIAPPYPNPARSSITVRYVVEEQQNVYAALYDALGRRVKVLQDGEILPFRRQTIRTDVSSLASGIYLLRIRGATAGRTERIAVVK